MRAVALLVLSCCVAAASSAQQVDISRGSIVQIVATLRPGQYVWAPEVAPQGPMLLIVNTHAQRAVLFRNGVPIAATTVSTGRRGRETPTGIFTVLQKQVVHHSSKYDNAPMPYMQRLTWQGVALHAGHLPGYPASHGCIRMPAGFAKLLYASTALGMTVVITDKPTQPRIAPAPDFIAGRTPTTAESASDGRIYWAPEKSPTGPVSIVVSAADRRAVVLRNGVEIGSGPVIVDGAVTGTWAYAYRNSDQAGPHWVEIGLAQAKATKEPDVPRTEWQRFRAPDDFKRAVAAIVQPGTTVVVTEDSLSSGGLAQPLTVLEGEPRRN
jgi:hypothetical protein